MLQRYDVCVIAGGRCNVTNAEDDRHRFVARYGRHSQALHSLPIPVLSAGHAHLSGPIRCGDKGGERGAGVSHHQRGTLCTIGAPALHGTGWRDSPYGRGSFPFGVGAVTEQSQNPSTLMATPVDRGTSGSSWNSPDGSLHEAVDGLYEIIEGAKEKRR